MAEIYVEADYQQRDGDIVLHSFGVETRLEVADESLYEKWIITNTEHLAELQQREEKLLAETKSRAFLAVAKYADQTATKIAGNIPLAEQLGWAAKEVEARTLLAGQISEEQAQMLSFEAQITGEAISDLATSVVAKADSYKKLVALIAGFRRSATGNIGNAKTLKDVDEILIAAQSKAETALEELL